MHLVQIQPRLINRNLAKSSNNLVTVKMEHLKGAGHNIFCQYKIGKIAAQITAEHANR